MSTEPKKAPQPGDTVYTADGRECVLVGRQHDGYVVRPVIDYGDSMEPPGQDLDVPEVAYKVYTTPPATRFSAEAAEARAERDAAHNQVAQAQEVLRDLTAAADRQRKALESHPQLQPVIDYLAGRITHVVIFSHYGSGFKLMELAEALKPGSNDSAKRGEVRLLALYGGYTGAGGPRQYEGSHVAQWRLNAYRDGSGNNEVCFFGTSAEEALARCQAYLDVEFKRPSDGNQHTLVSWARSAIEYGLQVPELWATRVAEADRVAAENRLASARKDVETYERALAEKRAALASLEAAQAPAGGVA